ncbi:MAG: TonB-dependent receptor plug domain-containing protein [Deltaproteobacteria bacterium]|nr:TonB-dependent receptor plug domain-containing protein [Deltaproteobacteria bacterium]
MSSLLRNLVVPTILVVAMSVPGVKSVFAEDPPVAPSSIPVMPRVTVTGRYIEPMSGSFSIDREQLERLPNKNGTITDYLKIVPGVQFSEGTDPSLQSGEIEPANVSISGGRGYENNFLIDGMSNSSNLDPYALKFDDVNILPTSPQEIFLSPSLIKSLTVFDHNISSRYGNFTGGVVESETVDPDSELSGEVSYRTTRDNWTKFYIDPDDQEDFQNADLTTRQPHFDKHYVTLQLSGPLSATQGLLFTYAQNYSQIPLTPFGSKETQFRRSENYYFKQHVYELSPDTTVKSSFTYAPYRARGFLNKTLHSNFTNSSDTYALQFNLETTNAIRTLEMKAALKKNTGAREAPDHFFSWNSAYGPTKNWGTLIGSSRSNEGGFGDLRRTEQSLNVQAHLSSQPIVTNQHEARVNLGVEYKYTQAKYVRPNTVYTYKTPVQLNPGDLCVANDPACVAGEQYLSKRGVYSAGSASDVVNSLSAYVELQEKIKRLTLRPGLRASYDDLMKNFNPAPRFSVSLDISGDEKATLTMGINRYYGQNLLAAKLREAIQPIATSTRPDQFTAWTDPSKNAYTTVTKFSNLKTPHSDELSFDYQQKVFSSTLILSYVYRQNKNQLAKEKDPNANPDGSHEITLNNNGYSEYKSYRLSWEKQWEKSSLAINATYEEITSSNESYTDTLDDGDLEDFVYHDGELKLKTDLPRVDFSRPWTVNMIYFADLPYGFSFSNTTRYQSRYRTLGDTRQNIIIDGKTYDIYDEISEHSALTFDWKVSWEKELLNQQYLEVTLDIYNVFNRKVPIGTESNEYKLGRQYWAGLTYKF